MEFNAIACPEELAIIAQAMGERIEGLSATEAAQRSVEAVRMLCKDIGIPEKLTELGVTKDDIPRLAEGTVMGNVETNPRRTTLEDVVRTFEAAL